MQIYSEIWQNRQKAEFNLFKNPRKLENYSKSAAWSRDNNDTGTLQLILKQHANLCNKTWVGITIEQHLGDVDVAFSNRDMQWSVEVFGGIVRGRTIPQKEVNGLGVSLSCSDVQRCL